MLPLPHFERLQVTEQGEVVVVTFVDRRLHHEQTVFAVGEELYALADARRGRKFVLDLGTVETLSSRALGVLIRLYRRVRNAGGELRLRGLPPGFGRFFRGMGED